MLMSLHKETFLPLFMVWVRARIAFAILRATNKPLLAWIHGKMEKWTWHGRRSRPTPFSLMWFYKCSFHKTILSKCMCVCLLSVILD